MVAAVALYLAPDARARLPTPPPWWMAQAACIHAHEAPAWNTNTGNGYYGGMQFTDATWRSVGGRLRADLAPRSEQLVRAYLVWLRDGGSWREWGTARACGLR